MVGIPKGRCSSVVGLGIQTRRTGCASWGSRRVLTKASLWSGVNDFLPSIPAVFLPWLSCVTRRTANSFVDREVINSLWSERTRLTLPQHWAW